MRPIGLHIAGGFDPGQDPFSQYARRLSETERHQLEARSGLKHARLLGSASAFALLAGHQLPRMMPSKRLGIICTGGPSNLPASTQFIERARLAGATLVNPLQFPGTLPSASATAVAAALGAHQFAFAVGHDRLAFFAALEQASLILTTAEELDVMILTASSNDSAVDNYRIHADLSRPIVDISIGFGLTRNVERTTLQLLGIAFGEEQPAPAVPTYSAEWSGGTFTCDFKTLLDDSDALSASGAVLCIAALQRHLAHSASPSSPFAVRLRSDGKAATALLRASAQDHTMSANMT